MKSCGAVGSPERAAWNAARAARLQKRLRESGLPVVECLECGKVFRSLINHLRTQHDGLTFREYRIKHQMKLGARVCAPDLQETFRELANEPERKARFKAWTNSPENRERLQEMRSDPKVGERIREIITACTTTEQIAERVNRLRDPKVQERARDERRRMEIEAGRTLVKNCPQCGEVFTSKRSDNLKYCSQACWELNREEATRPQREKGRATIIARSLERRQAKCLGCGITFLQRSGGVKNMYYCTSRCANSFRPRDAKGRIAPGTTNPRRLQESNATEV